MSDSVRPIDVSPSDSPVPGILQARTLKWVAISFSNAWKWKVKGKSLSRVQLSATPWTAAYQAPLSMCCCKCQNFILFHGWISFHYWYHIFFIHLSVGGHLSCFNILASVNAAAMIIGVYASFQISDFFLIPRNKVSGSHDNSIFNFWGNLHSVFHSGWTFTFLLTLYKSSLFFTSSPTFLIYRIF